MGDAAIISVVPTPSTGTRYDSESIRQWLHGAGHRVTFVDRFFVNTTFAEHDSDTPSRLSALFASALGRTGISWYWT